MAAVIFRRTDDSVAINRGPRTNVVALLILMGSLGAGSWMSALVRNPVPAVVMALLGIVLMQAPKVAQQWERAIVLRLGRYVGMQGLRAMNMLYEGLKEKGALMLIPSRAVESMGMGGLLGAAALRQDRLVGGDNK